MSPEIDERLTASVGQKLRLRPDEWKSGDFLWTIDVAGDSVAAANALLQLDAMVLKDKPTKMVITDEQGVPKIEMLRDLTARSEQREAA